MWSHRWRAMPPISEVWKYVTRRDDKTIVCNMCGSQLACSGSATVLRLHLQRNHRIHFTEETDCSNLQGADSTTEKIPCAKERTPKITELIGIDSPVTRTSQSSKRISDMLRECAARLEEGEELEQHSILGVEDAHTALTEDELSMVLRSYQVSGGGRRRAAELSLQRAAPASCPDRERDRAQTWDFFKKLNQRCVQCSLCRKQLCYHNSTASLREHLRRRHQLGELEARQLPDDGSSSSESLGQEPEVKRAAVGGSEPALPGARAGAEKREELLDDLIAGMVFRDLQPLSLVTEDGFRRLLRFLQPDYRVPSVAQLSAQLRHQYTLCKVRLERQLRSVPSLALSTHGWSTPARHGYLTVFAHFIDGGWSPARCVLRTGRAGAGASRELLRSALADFGLPGRAVSCVVHEGAPGAAGGGERLAPGCRHLCCAGRTLQQCVRHGLQLEAVQRALAAARRLVAHFQRSGRASARLAQGGGEAPEPLVLDTASRWDTTAEMCRRLVRARRAVRAALEEERAEQGEEEPPVANLTEPQWELLGALLPVLKPLQVALSFLGERQNAAASALLPCLHGVVSALAQHPAEPGCPAGAVGARIRAEISQRWHLQEEGELLAHPAALASFLDPRFKDLRFLGARARDQLQRRVKALLSAGVPEPGSPAGERRPEPGSPAGERRPEPGSRRTSGARSRAPRRASGARSGRTPSPVNTTCCLARTWCTGSRRWTSSWTVTWRSRSAGGTPTPSSGGGTTRTASPPSPGWPAATWPYRPPPCPPAARSWAPAGCPTTGTTRWSPTTWTASSSCTRTSTTSSC
ncbi:E3 SUMO-protein ligase ZBED1-like [Pristis pectinata]|uniref:E3 SUMO-protein ligase ZBED1-like n=1 Tax=Pristis pectinata TaxID=685728 RepID=UPI00223E80BF|nr:E3 SUMO-protein ligase ZBED1-like [Pristis pectinata]XP_051900317.1 E3 SUMO-protein ligase ZBED1-like [Pristis pectinata]